MVLQVMFCFRSKSWCFHAEVVARASFSIEDRRTGSLEMHPGGKGELDDYAVQLEF